MDKHTEGFLNSFMQGKKALFFLTCYLPIIKNNNKTKNLQTILIKSLPVLQYSQIFLWFKYMI